MPRVDPIARAAYRHEQWITRKSSGLCVDCGKLRRSASDRGGKPSLRCQSCCDARRKAWRKCTTRRQVVFHAENLCSDCGKVPCPDRAYCDVCRARRLKAYREKYRDKRLADHRIAYQILKRLVFNAYGGCHCACCGVSHMEFLSIDHVNNDGAEHRRLVHAAALYGWLKRNNFPTGYRVLCMNCNFATGHGGYCPHYHVQGAPA